MEPARIAELLEPFLGTPLPAAGSLIRSISIYIDILLRWNARINLTAIRDPEAIVTRHFGESLFAARRLFFVAGSPDLARPHTPPGAGLHPAGKVADLGSGAGFPGLPAKLLVPEISLTLIESNQKKVAFLREVVRALTLTDVDVFPGRAAALDAHAFAIVLLRAVEKFSAVLPEAARLVQPEGSLVLLIGSAQVELVRTLLPHFSWQDPVTVPASRSRVLMVGKKSAVSV